MGTYDDMDPQQRAIKLKARGTALGGDRGQAQQWMMMAEVLKAAEAERVVELERQQRMDERGMTGDFEGSVVGTWVRLNQDGSGLVRYRNKEYITKPLGFASIFRNTPVELTYLNGIYYSKY